MNVIDELRWRGMTFDMTEGAGDMLVKEKIAFYNGFDVQGPDLHVGHLVPIMGMVHLQRYGHTPIALVGGGTSMVGDPSGRSTERNLLSIEQVEANARSVHHQLQSFLDFDNKTNPARMINNADWLLSVGLMDFLRDVGKHFTVNQMIAKESVKLRMDQEQGISFTEFSYMLLQAYDFYVLYRDHGCRMQTGGSDQWGNIVAGVDLIRRLDNGKAHGLVYPLLTNASGEKFGKTATITGMDSVWLNPEKTSPYKFYQYWFNTDDADVIRNLRLFTLMDQEQVAEFERAVAEAPERREAQKALAEDVTRRVHGDAGLQSALKASEVLFGGSIDGLSAGDLLGIFADVPSSDVAGSALSLVDAVVQAGFEGSKGRARTLISSGGIALNNLKIADPAHTLQASDFIDGKVAILRKGKRDYHVLKAG
jgi:tyrosyl-tRNA synthetase